MSESLVEVESSPWSGLYDACPVGGGEWFCPLSPPLQVAGRRVSCCNCFVETREHFYILSGYMRSEKALHRAEQIFRLPSTSISTENGRFVFSVRACQQCVYLLHGLYNELVVSKILTEELYKRLHRPSLDAYS